ncbi:hypothetical protein OF83DRAFT_1175371 [Amylostereum chailletii]|nr:hypothetical protein OF83DRAFT_1175371 [Amylostereum chailletii]
MAHTRLSTFFCFSLVYLCCLAAAAALSGSSRPSPSHSHHGHRPSSTALSSRNVPRSRFLGNLTTFKPFRFSRRSTFGKSLHAGVEQQQDTGTPIILLVTDPAFIPKTAPISSPMLFPNSTYDSSLFSGEQGELIIGTQEDSVSYRSPSAWESPSRMQDRVGEAVVTEKAKDGPHVQNVTRRYIALSGPA